MNEFRIDATGSKRHWWMISHNEAEILAIGFSLPYSIRQDRQRFLIEFFRLMIERNSEVLNIRHATMLEF